MTIILRTLEGEGRFKRSNKRSKHLNSREQRVKLSIDNSAPIHHYEVFRRGGGDRQIHALYNDATLFIYNKTTGLIVTLILLERDELSEYLSHTGENFNDYPATHKCAKLHERVNEKETEDNIADFRMRKINILRGVN